ncbi:MAG: Flagellar number regulator FleN [uncultured bacterium]|nr:MAG: Flagellar number regulator FleN [uncultured bacterium]
MDQAQELRILTQKFSVDTSTSNDFNLKITSVTGGKGGVGKSNIALNLSIALSELGERVCLMDADFGLANIDILLGLKPKFNIAHVFSGQKKISEILVKGPGNIQIIPASSGLKHLADLSQEALSMFAIQAKELGRQFDHIIIDTSAGIARNVLTFLLASTHIIVVATPEPTSITDSYALLKTLTLENNDAKTMILMNMCRKEDEGTIVGNRLIQICKHFLNITPELIGIVNYNTEMSNSIRKQKALLEAYPNSIATLQIKTIAQRLKNLAPKTNDLGNFFNSLKAFIS